MKLHAIVMILVIAISRSAETIALQTNGTPDLGEATRFFTDVVGQWACAGSFADGRPLAADLSFVATMDGRAVRYVHRDRAPNRFVEEATWGPDTANHQLVSVAFMGSAETLIPALFVSTQWSARSVILESRPLTSPPFATNRFTYTLEAPNTLRVVWEVLRAGNWTVGDALRCTRR
jgi:hypothetical protein